MTGISSKAAEVLASKLKYNSKEEQRQEFSDGSGLEWLDYGARMMDNQTGRWLTIDQLSEKFYDWSPYVYALDNPIRYDDKDGRAPGDPIADLVKKVSSQSQTFTNMLNSAGITLNNVNNFISYGPEPGYSDGKITIQKTDDYKTNVSDLAHEVTNLINGQLFDKLQADFKSGVSSEKNAVDEAKNDEKYAKSIVDIESKGILNQIIVAYETGIDLSGSDGLGTMIASRHYKEGLKKANGDPKKIEALKETILKELKEGASKIAAGPDAGKDAIEVYKKQARTIRDGVKRQ